MPIFALIPAFLIGGILSLSITMLIGRLVREIRGKGIFVIGAEAVGKTTLISFLGGHVDSTSTTDHSIEYQSFVVKHAGNEIYIKKGSDVSGLEEDYHVWKRGVLSADFVFYLVNVYRAGIEDSDSYNRRLKLDAERLTRWIDEAKPRPSKIIVVGTHCDKFPPGQRPHQTPACLSDFSTLLGKCPEPVAIAFGSLKNRTEFKTLMRKISRILIGKN